MHKRDVVTLLLLVLMSFFLMCDMFITPAIVAPLSTQYGVSDVELSWVSSLFILLGAIVGVVIGQRADRANRKHLLIAIILIGEIPCFLTGLYWFTDTFTGFVILRTLCGIGIGGIYPLTFSLVSDYFTSRHRAKACAAVDLAWGIGTVIGPLLATFAMTTEYGWRLAFLLAAAPNFPLVLLFALIAREPARGHADMREIDHLGETQYQTTETGGAKWADFRLLMRVPTNRLMFLQGIPGSIPWGLFPFWLIIIFTQTNGFSHEQSVVIWEVFGLSAGLGGFMWALVGDKVFHWRAAYLPAMCASGIFIGIIPCALIFNGVFTSFTACTLMALLSGVLISVPSSNCKAILMNVNRPEHRGRVFALYNLCDNIGKGLGPAFGGVVLSATASYATMANSAIALWLLCGCLFSLMVFTLGKDRQACMQHLHATSQPVT